MPYYSYGYGYDSANLVYLILLVPVSYTHLTLPTT